MRGLGVRGGFQEGRFERDGDRQEVPGAENRVHRPFQPKGWLKCEEIHAAENGKGFDINGTGCMWRQEGGWREKQSQIMKSW